MSNFTELYKKYMEIQAERDRLREALERIAVMQGHHDKVVCLGVIQLCADVAQQALQGEK